jgi:HSP20 family protein
MRPFVSQKESTKLTAVMVGTTTESRLQPWAAQVAGVRSGSRHKPFYSELPKAAVGGQSQPYRDHDGIKEAFMDLRSLVPFTPRSNLARADLNPFDVMRQFDGLFSDLARSLGVPPNGSAAMLAPRMEVTETDKDIEISAELPGLERKDVDISLDGNVLTIRAEKKVDEERKDKNVHLAERSYGVFYRVLELPTRVDPSTVQATMSKGVLKITIPKPAQTEAKKIEVKEAA